ncbi:sodium/proline symporter PutP [Cobetia marina]|jgi:sodium/proline symporter|uniref:Sodium/proline symporter n=1 Tax=Cobetia marina TaxID=28258 RepID=A0ABU9GCF9_COBMA|nr:MULTISPECIES: sodium/proline symporter PutP [Cobetia]AOM01821.1 sodium/proline symporter [Cobetia marina]MDA5562223.1 sodium/proline symporter PutP [Cobetia sp. MMG027]MDH2290297.1 sodium/proline symporter PutP [Cobetia sp. 10Alg 146]MDH2375129.1 sodium/proline symporter PutP [Cobetia sp. 3AK]MDI6002165.1 sodium/proline symporter PutP [Cobetia pacifica]
MVENSPTILITFAVYLAVMLGIGLLAYKRTSNMSDYILGGRSLGPWTSAISAGASDMSGWLLLGLPGAAYLSGLSAAWIGIGLLAGTWLNWLIVAKRLRIYSFVASDSLTLPDYFEKRFRDNSKMLRVISAVFILLFFLFYTSSGLVAGGKLFETVFGLDYTIAVTVGTIAIVSYTFFGGFLAVSWTDLIQGLMMAAALIVVPIVALTDMGGVAEASSRITAENPLLLEWFRDASTGEALTLVGIISSLAWGLGYFGQPHILARFAAIRSEKDVGTARTIAVIWSALGLFAAICIGLLGLVYVPKDLADSEKIFMVMVNFIFHPAVAGVLLAAILAAVMSTADSQLLVSSSALADDFYKALFKKDATQSELVWVGRFAVIGIAIIAWVLALDPNSSVLGLVSYAWAGFGAAFGPALIMSLYWRRMNRFGALAGIIVGGVTVVVWKQLSGGIFDLYEIVPGVIFAYIAIYVVSIMTAAPSDEITDEFEQVENHA